MKFQTTLFVLLISCFSSFSLIAQDKYNSSGLHGEWLVKSVGGEELPSEIEMILAFKDDKTLSMTSPEGQQSGTWAMNEGSNSILVESSSGKETWIITKLTQEELWLKDKVLDETMKLSRYTSNSINEASESQEETPSNGELQINELIDTWTVVSIGELEVEKENVIFRIKENGILELPSPSGVMLKAKWKWNDTKTALLIEPQEGNDEVWNILSLDASRLKIKDNYGAIIILMK